MANARLKGHRLEQLKLLADVGADCRDTAAAVGFDCSYRPGTLSAMIGEGLVGNAYLPFQGDSRRRVSHYWLTDGGREALASRHQAAQ